MKRLLSIVEAAPLTADGPMQVKELQGCLTPEEMDDKDSPRVIKECLVELEKKCESRSIELKRVASISFPGKQNIANGSAVC